MGGVRFDRVTKLYGRITAVKDVDFDAADGEFLVLLGPSGCGKTTILRLAAGLERPTHGRVYIDDADVTDIEPKDRNIAMVFQSYALYPHMDVGENLSFGLKMRGIPTDEREKRVNGIAGMLGIEHLLKRKPKELSGGEKQRVAVGRAIVRNPSVFLMDEPLSSLDAKLRVQMRAELLRLHRELGTTFLYVTHDQTEATMLGNRIAVINNGQVRQIGSPDEIYRNPVNLFVAGFIGTPPMNLVSATFYQKEKTFFSLGEAQVGIDDRAHEALIRNGFHVGDKVVIGIRPGDISAGLIETKDEPSLKGTIELVEVLGTEVFVHVQTQVGVLTAKHVGNLSFRVGDAIRVSLKQNAIHIFDPETGNRI
ncbi:MAG: ABC transporter ATP-binding protein [Actinobacteria bacterium]|nr:ABC transporter ATP-binding protein [Actinomycetota bacterium]